MTMTEARKWYRKERGVTHVDGSPSFRQWARKTFDFTPCKGKLHKIVNGGVR